MKDKINRFKQLFKIMTDELNVHEFIWEVVNTDKGEIILHYYNPLATDNKEDFFVTVGKKRIKNDKILLSTADLFFKRNI